MKYIVVMAVAAVLLNTGCKKVNETEFDLTYNADFIVQPTSNTAFQIFDQKVIVSNIDSKMKEYGSSIDNIKEITLSSYTVDLTNPADEDLGTFELGECWILTSSLSEVKLASVAIPETCTDRTLTYSPMTSNLTSFLKCSSFTLVAKGKLRHEVTSAISLKGTLKVHVKAKIL